MNRALLKERPWSLVRQITFESGTYYFKACSTAGQHEISLLHFLKNRSWAAISKVVATELNLGWILLADAGTRLGDLQPSVDHPRVEQLAILTEALSDYAQLQMASLAWREQLLDLGLPDRRVDRLPALLKGLLADDVIGTGHSVEALRNLRQRANGLLPEFEQLCAKLGERPYADALDHGDFHMCNLLIRDGTHCLIDWGDASVTHPFFSILVTLETALKQIPKTERAQWRNTLRDAYLAPWAVHTSRAKLLIDFERAMWVAHVGRALDLGHMFSGADEETLNQWRPMIFERLEIWVRARFK